MKQYRYITSEQSIASYMLGFNTNEMTYDQYNEWSDYLEKKLTTGNIQAKVYYSSNDLMELERQDKGYLFNIGNKSITLARGKTLDHLDYEVMSYMDVDTLLAVIDAIDAYQKENQPEPEERK